MYLVLELNVHGIESTVSDFNLSWSDWWFFLLFSSFIFFWGGEAFTLFSLQLQFYTIEKQKQRNKI